MNRIGFERSITSYFLKHGKRFAETCSQNNYRGLFHFLHFPLCYGDGQRKDSALFEQQIYHHFRLHLTICGHGRCEQFYSTRVMTLLNLHQMHPDSLLIKWYVSEFSRLSLERPFCILQLALKRCALEFSFQSSVYWVSVCTIWKSHLPQRSGFAMHHSANVPNAFHLGLSDVILLKLSLTLEYKHLVGFQLRHYYQGPLHHQPLLLTPFIAYQSDSAWTTACCKAGSGNFVCDVLFSCRNNDWNHLVSHQLSFWRHTASKFKQSSKISDYYCLKYSTSII